MFLYHEHLFNPEGGNHSIQSRSPDLCLILSRRLPNRQTNPEGLIPPTSGLLPRSSTLTVAGAIPDSHGIPEHSEANKAL